MKPSTRFRTSTGSLLVLCLAFASASCGSKVAHDTTNDAAAPVTLGLRDVDTVAVRPLAAGVTVTGSLDPARTVAVMAELAGQIVDVRVDRGTVVRQGQTLARYDDRASRAAAASARAQLASADRDASAADTLWRAGAISERDFVNAKAARDASAARAVSADQDLRHATVVAPITGVVSDRVVSAGESVRIGDPLFTVVNSDELEMAGQIDPNEVAHVRVGQRVRLVLDAYPGRSVQGRVERIEPVANPGTRQVGVHVRVPNRNHSLVAGLFATGTIITSEEGTAGADRPAIPADAVVNPDTEPVVYVVDAGVIRIQAVTLGLRDVGAALVQIRSGLEAGEIVVIRPGGRLSAGTRVSFSDSVAQGGH